MKRISKSISFIVCLGLGFGCSDIGSGDKGQTYLARVDNTYLTLEQARNQVNDFALEQDSTAALKKYRKQWIQRQLLLKEVHNLQLAQQPKIRKKLEQAREEVLLNGLRSAIFLQNKKQSHVSDAEALNFYQQHEQQLTLNERYVKIRYIENRELSAARTARQYLQNDSSWVEVARSYSINPEKKIDLSKQFWPVSSLFKNLPLMKQYASRLDSAQFSPIQRRQGIYRFIQLTDVRKQGQAANPRWFIDELKDWLRHEKQRKYYNSYVKNLYLNAKEDNEVELFNVSIKNINDNPD